LILSMRQLQVTFASGKEVLASYWGFLANGGLVLREPCELAEGEAVSVEVTIRSSAQTYTLRGRVVHARNGLAPRAHAVIAFDPGEPQDFLLSSAWSEVDNVPARRHRRYPVDAGVHLRTERGEVLGRLINISSGGCCVRVLPGPGEHGIGTGKTLSILADGEISCTVRWICAADMGLEFGDANTSVIRQFLQKLL
jgi:hypothetical protein